MKRHRLLAVAGVLVLGIAAAAWFLTRPQAPEQAAGPPGPPAPQERETALPHSGDEGGRPPRDLDLSRTSVPAAPAPVAVSAAIPESYSKTLAGVRGRLIAEAGRPLAGLEVSLLETDPASLFPPVESLFAGEEPPDLELELASTTTDRDGVFLLAGARARALHALGIDLGGQRSTLRVVEAPLRRGVVTDLGDIVLPASVTLFGRVVDEKDRPLAGVRVRATTLPPMLLDMGLDRVRRETRILLIDAGPGPTVLEIPPWLARYEDRLPLPTTHTDTRGAFRLESIEPGLVTLIADRAGRSSAFAGPQPTGRRSERDVGTMTMARGRTASVRVEDSSGRPVSDVEVLAGPLITSGDVALVEPATRTAREGVFTLSGLPPEGRVAFAARRRAEDAWVIEGPTDALQATIVLPETARLRVAIVDASGEPVPGADLRYRPAPPAELPLALFSFRRVQATSKDGVPGRIEIPVLSPGAYSFVARAAGYALTTRTVTLAPGQETTLKLVLERGVEIDVHVLDAETRAPIEYALVTARAAPLPEAAAGRTRTDEQGAARLGPVAPGDQTILITAQHPGWGPGSIEVTLGDPAARDPVAIELARAGKVSGTIHFSGHRPVERYTVVVNATLERTIPTPDLLAPRWDTSDPEGHFEIGDLAAGSYRYEIYPRFLDKDPLDLLDMTPKSSPKQIAAKTFEITSGQVTELLIDLAPRDPDARASLRGTVLFGGHPARRSKIQVLSETEEEFEASVDEQGRFLIDELPTGETQVVIMRQPGLAPGGPIYHSESLDLVAGEVKTLAIDILAIPLDVLVVSGTSGETLESIPVEFNFLDSDHDEMPRGGFTDARGLVHVGLPRTGKWAITARHQEHGKARRIVDLPAAGIGEPVRLELDAGVPCAGRVSFPPDATERAGTMLILGVVPDQGKGKDPTLDLSQTALDKETHAFRLTGLEPGRYIAYLFGADNAYQTATFTLTEQGNEHLVLEFRPADR